MTFAGEHFRETDAEVAPRPMVRGARWHPRPSFGGPSAEAERVAAADADIQLLWGEPLDDVGERIARLRRLADELGRAHPPLEFGRRVTTVVRDTAAQAWADAEARVAALSAGAAARDRDRQSSVGQQGLLGLGDGGDVLDGNLFTAPGRHGGAGAGTTWGGSSCRR